MFLLRKQEEKNGWMFFSPCKFRSNNIAQRIDNSVAGSGKLAYSAQAVTQEPERVMLKRALRPA